MHRHWVTALLATLHFACSDSAPSEDAGTCSPDPSACAAAGADCGRITVDGRCVTCGSCSLPATCGGAAQANVCGCPTVECGQANAECGLVTTGCDEQIDCGACSGGLSCIEGQCGVAVPPEGDCSDPKAICPSGYTCCPTPGSRGCLLRPNGTCVDVLPDLSIDYDATASSTSVEEMTFPRPSTMPMFPDLPDCAIQEGCAQAGDRRLLRFATQVNNFGTGELNLGTPATNPNFELNECHAHYHFLALVGFRLYERNPDGTSGREVGQAGKISFCLLDSVSVDSSLPGSPASARFVACSATEDAQGISIGWGDLYDETLDCQWMDITGIPAGEYVLEQTANPAGLIDELRYMNNTTRVNVTIP